MPSVFENWVKGPEAWGQYLTILKQIERRISAELARRLKDLGTMDPTDTRYRFAKKGMLDFVQREITDAETLLQSATPDVMSGMKDQQEKWVTKQIAKGASTGFNDFMATEAAVYFANYEADLGNRLAKHAATWGKKTKGQLAKALKIAENQLKAGQISGLGVEPIVSRVKWNAIGMPKGKHAKGLTADIRRTVTTQLSAMQYDLSDKYGRTDKNIVGVTIQRGPGECPTDICGIVLGVSENEMANFIYGANDPPVLPIHPNGYCDIVNYIYADDLTAIHAAQNLAYKQGSNRTYKAYTKGRTAAKKELKRYQKDFWRKKKAA